ncbi:MAG: hypothetical protein IKA01_09915 [Alistipes sp.]|nr:hypothetical protein [Alistipes sp.]
MFRLVVESEEQSIVLSNGYVAELRYNVFNKYWYYNLMDVEGNYIFYGMALKPDSCPTYRLTHDASIPKLVILDEARGSKEPYNPYVEIGGRLGLYEI